jgi:hypothetical protein
MRPLKQGGQTDAMSLRSRKLLNVLPASRNQIVKENNNDEE